MDERLRDSTWLRNSRDNRAPVTSPELFADSPAIDDGTYAAGSTHFSAVVKHAGTSGFVASGCPRIGFPHPACFITIPLTSSPPAIRDKSQMR